MTPWFSILHPQLQSKNYMRQLQLLRSTLDNASIFELNSKGKDSKIEKDNKQVYDKLDHSLYI